MSTSTTCVATSGPEESELFEGCYKYEIHLVKSGNLSGTDGKGSCGTLRQSLTLELSRYGQDWVFSLLAGSDNGHGEISVNNAQCTAAIYGVMPGDNVTILPNNATASIGGDGQIISREGNAVVVDVNFTGQLRDGSRIQGEGQARLTVRNESASGDIHGELFLRGHDEPIAFQGSLRLENVVIGDDGAFTVQGTMRVIPSSTQGATTD